MEPSPRLASGLSGRDHYETIYREQLARETEWLRRGARMKADAISALLTRACLAPDSILEIGAGVDAVLSCPLRGIVREAKLLNSDDGTRFRCFVRGFKVCWGIIRLYIYQPSMRFLTRFLAAAWLLTPHIGCAPSAEPPASTAPLPITHSFFVAGPGFTGILGETGDVVWDSGRPGARDGYVLPNGNVLICWSDVVQEFDAGRQVVFSYALSPENAELGTAVRLDDGSTMITELGAKPRIVEVDRAGVILREVPLQPETDNAHMQTRMARKLPNGNYLVPHLLAFAVKEYTPAGEVVQTIRTDRHELGGREAENWPFTAIRLANGHTLINLTHGNKTIEVDAAGAIVWRMSNDDVDAPIFVDPCGAQRLPNGNTVIASYGATEGVKLFEVTPAKEVVWTYEGHRVHHFQILTTNGRPVEGTPLK